MVPSMPTAACKKELLNFMKKGKGKALSAVVMPDFFLDRIINLRCDVTEFSALVADVAERKGGSVDGITQVDIKGGNAVNTGSALASLGFKVTPIMCTSSYGLEQLKYHFKDFQMDFSHIKVHDKASITTALELKTDSGKVNVMLRDVGALANFGPEDLDETDFTLVENTDYVCLFNWAGTIKHGTVLAQRVFEEVKQNGKAKTYFDTADPLPNKAEISNLIDKVLTTNLIDVLSVNENEAITYAAFLDKSIEEKKTRLGFAELALEAARVLAKHFSARIDLHTTAFSASLVGCKEVVVPTFKIKPVRATGAGDAWNAGNILGDGNGLSSESRLMLANAVSACYLTDKDGVHPSWSKLEGFIRSSV
jgi:sugar/nucleoside kinase (ribokinase family)